MNTEPCWFALYTKPRFEKRAYDSLTDLGFTAYLPLYRTLKQWSDRKKWVDEILFKSYCFVNIRPERYREPLKAQGVVRYIWYDGKPAKVQNKEIEYMKMLCGSGFSLETTALTLQKGQAVKISGGALNGLEGEFINHAGQHKVLVRIDSINHGILVTVPEAMVAVA